MGRLATLVPSPLRPYARQARDYIRRWERAPLNDLLDPAGCRAELEPVGGRFSLERRSSTACPVRVRNLENAVWSSQGRHPVYLTVRWLSNSKQPIDVTATRYALPAPVHPGKTVLVDASLTAPDSLGHYLVEIDRAQEGGPTFGEHGPGPALVEVRVTGRDADDIDYHNFYASTDLTRDYWTVVGPGTEDEFHRLAAAKFQYLKDVGLTPASRVLDVGCGTGQLATVLEPFLEDRGTYLGTDIDPKAVAFCRDRFCRPNFRFAQNAMTAVPVGGEAFDYVAFFSVFTHTFPDETAILLAEAARLLAPNGRILCDVFTSPLIERCAGNRGAMELNRDHFLRLAGLAGLRGEVLTGWPWRKHGRRELFVFTRTEPKAAG